MTDTTNQAALELADKARELVTQSRTKAVQAANAMTDLRAELERSGRSTQTDLRAMCNTFDALALEMQSASLELSAAWLDLWSAARGTTWEDK